MRAAIAFLTPFGRATVPKARTMGWFPFVGILVGVAVGGVWWAATKAFPAGVSAALAVSADAALTGLLHLDGLADAADGLLPPMDRARRLVVMGDPSVGAFGVVTVSTVLLVRFAAFSDMRPAPLVVAALWGVSRTAMAVISRALPYARSEGLATAFAADAAGEPASRSDDRHSPPRWRAPGTAGLVAGTALCVVLAAAGRGVHGVAALVGAVIGCVAVALFARRRIGGFTGDVLGAAGVVGETLGLVVLAARLS